MKTKKQRLILLISLIAVAVIAVTLTLVLVLTNNKPSDGPVIVDPTDQDKEFTVTYNVDGKVTTEIVKDGKTATKPADPEKDGYSFYGWFTDEKYTKGFSFETVITSDITLYARLYATTYTADSFNIEFIDDGEVVKTAKTDKDGKVGALQSGKHGDLLGWWVSDYDDADKLTYKYDGRVLGQDTKLFAVYKTDEPTVSVTSDVITWNAVTSDERYLVKITDTHGYTLERRTSALSYEYGFEDREAGDYVISVTLGDKTSTAYYRNKALNKISRFNVDSSTLTFNDVNADKYVLTVDCGDKEHVHKDVELGKETYYDFINCEMQPGGIKFTVTALADGKAESVSEFVYERHLDSITDLKVDPATDLVSWAKVEGADGYTLKITQNGVETSKYLGDVTQYSLKNYSGDLDVSVVAEAKGYNPAVATLDYTKTKLATPVNVKVTADAISWTAVEGANGYTVKIGDNEYTANTATLSLTDVSLPRDGYTVTVKANAAAEANSSAYSDGVEVKKTLTADDITYADGKLTWNGVVGATAYSVKVNGGEEIAVTDGSNSAVLAFDKGGYNTVSVAYTDKDGNKSAWVDKNVAVYAVNFHAEDKVTTKYYATGDEISFPTAERTGYTLGNWYNSLGGAQNNAAKYSEKIFDGVSNLDLYASWLPGIYSVTLNVGEYGEEIADTVEVKYNDYFELPIPVSTNNLKGFIGWYTQPEGKGARYTDGLGESLAQWSVTTDYTLYARWEDMFKFELDEEGEGYKVVKSGYTSAVKEITIPATYEDPETHEVKPVTTIDASAFMLCQYLRTINIPDSIKDIQTGTAFKWCYALENVNIYPSDVKVKGDYYSYDGALFRKDVNNVLEISYFPIGRTGEYRIPETIKGKDEAGQEIDMVVKNITASVFNQAIINKITIPYTVELINKNAFNSCNSLEQIVFEETPKTVVDEQKLEINEGAFNQCNSLRSITLTTRIENFTSAIIYYCSSLEYIDIVGEKSDYASMEGMITNANKDTLIYVPTGRVGVVEIPEGINKIAQNAFRTGSTSYTSCTKITKVIIPSWVTEIGAHAFEGCTGIRSLEFRGTLEDKDLDIGEYAFYNNTGLTTVTLSENVKSVGAYAFGRTRNLTTVTINTNGDIATSFAKGAFCDEDAYSNESYVKNVILGEHVGAINLGRAFSISILQSVTLDDKNTNHVFEDGVLYNAEKTAIEFYSLNKVGEYVIPDTVTEITAGFFANNPNLTSVVIGKGVTTIGEEAFKNCYGLTSVTFAADGALTTIGDRAFQNCRLLESFTLPATVTTLGSANSMLVFDGCSRLETISIAEGNEHFVFDEYNVLYSNDYKTLYMVFPNVTGDADGKLVVNAAATKICDKAFGNNENVKIIEFAGSGISSFGAGLLEGNTTVEEIALPDSITEIGEGMFKGCAGLKKFTVSKDVTTIKTRAFEDCVNLTEIVFEEGRTQPLTIEDGQPEVIGKTGSSPLMSTFGGTKNIEKITLPEGTVVGAFAFYKAGVKEVEFLGDATVGPYSFAYSAIEKITFNGAVNLSDYYREVGSGRGAMRFDYKNAQDCFWEAKNLQTVEFKAESGLTIIPSYFFYNCSSLENVVNLPLEIKEVGSNAFRGTKIKSLTFGKDLETLGTYAFLDCKQLETVTFDPECPLTEIKDAFRGSGITKLVLPNNVKEFGSGSNFYGCSNLTEFTIPEETTTIPYLMFSGTGLTSIVIPVNVTSIGQNAFKDCVNLKSVTFANPTESKFTSFSSSQPFANCGIEEFVFPENGKTITLPSNGVFSNCTTIKKVTLSAGITNINGILLNNTSISELILSEEGNFVIENGAIYDKENKSTLYKVLNPPEKFVVPDTVKTIAQYAFAGCDELKEVTISENVESLGNYAFQYCENLEKVNIETEHLTAIGMYVFRECKSLTSIDLPDSIVRLDGWAFMDCENLTNIKMDSVTQIGPGTFRNTGLVEVDLSNITGYYTTASNAANYAYSAAFYGCQKLKKVDFGTSAITYVMQSMFQACPSLEEVILNENQTIVESSAFGGCVSLKEIDFSHVEKTIDHRKPTGGYVGNVFNGCASLEKITLNDNFGLIPGTMFKGCESLKEINIPSKITLIKSEAFNGCKSLGNINIPSTVTEIDSYAFKDCVSMTEFKLPSNLTTIGDYAFEGTGISEIIIPASVNSIGGAVFSGCADLTAIVIDGANQTYYSTKEGGVYGYNGKLYFYAAGAEGSITIEPNAVISANAFKGCDKITEVIIPEGINEIGSNAFNGATGLKSVVIPVTVRTIGSKAFANTGLEEIEIPDSVIAIEESAFEGCELLVSVKLPKNLASISRNTFKGCISLKEITVPENLDYIMVGAFEGCESLEKVVLNDNLKELGCLPKTGKVGLDEPKGSVFKGCVNIKTIVIPEAVTVIYADTFSGWTEEQTIYFRCPESLFTGEEGWNNECQATIVFGYTGD